ncbi:hypothetical protein RB25_11530 [Herbaspirillum rubrisubalbicans]|nr:hypothetical protein RB25_11530 [Herbaspirillum rubrisubalbicans]
MEQFARRAIFLGFVLKALIVLLEGRGQMCEHQEVGVATRTNTRLETQAVQRGIQLIHETLGTQLVPDKRFKRQRSQDLPMCVIAKPYLLPPKAVNEGRKIIRKKIQPRFYPLFMKQKIHFPE